MHPVSARVSRLLVAAAVSVALPAMAAEYPIGKQHIEGGMELGTVYLQPITMDPEGMMRKASDSDIHLETDIHAVKNNPTGFAEGDWMPYLQVKYELSKVGTTQSVKGVLMPMVANDGPHYGDNVKLYGPGKYHVKIIVAPPSHRQGNRHRSVVQAVHGGIRLPVRRHRQEGWLLNKRSGRLERQ